LFVMVAGRQQGKSVTAVRWLLEQPSERVLLTSTMGRQEHLVRIAGRLLPVREMSHQAFVDFKDYIAKRILAVGVMRGYDFDLLRGIAAEVGIDDAEEVLQTLLQRRVGFAAFNATLVPVVVGASFGKGYVDAEQVAVEAPRAIRGRPIRDNPQA